MYHRRALIMSCLLIFFLGCESKHAEEEAPKAAEKNGETQVTIDVAGAQTDKPPSSQAKKSQTGTNKRPEGVDEVMWQRVLEGPGDVSPDILASMVPLDASVSLVFRPSLLQDYGLLRPVLEALPREARAAYQSATEALGGDILSRFYVLGGYLKGSIERSQETDEPVQIGVLAYSHSGMVIDVFRLVSSQQQEPVKKVNLSLEMLWLEEMGELEQKIMKEAMPSEVDGFVNVY